MHQSDAVVRKGTIRAGEKVSKLRRAKAETHAESRYTVALPSNLSSQVERYAESVDSSMSKAIAALVRIGLESQEKRKREFFKKLKENLNANASGDPKQEDRLVDEFRSLILGR